jgi:hypothetical protein
VVHQEPSKVQRPKSKVKSAISGERVLEFLSVCAFCLPRHPGRQIGIRVYSCAFVVKEFFSVPPCLCGEIPFVVKNPGILFCDGMRYVNGAPWNTQDAVAGWTEPVSP